MFQNLRMLRESIGMTQKEFAAEIGVSYSTYNGYEVGIREPKSDFWMMLATKYNVSMDYLLGITDYPTPLFDIKKATPSEDEDTDKIELNDNYDGMNEAGQFELLKQSRLLLNAVEYKKCGQSKPGKGIA